MLLGEDFRGRHPERLPPTLDDAQRRKPGNHGLPRSNVALYQPLHRLLAGHVLLDFAEHTLLRAGELERQQLPHAGAQRDPRWT